MKGLEIHFQNPFSVLFRLLFFSVFFTIHLFLHLLLHLLFYKRHNNSFSIEEGKNTEDYVQYCILAEPSKKLNNAVEI